MGEEKTVNAENIRYTLGSTEYEGRVETQTGFNNGLKREDPVVIIHRDDFMQLIDQPRDPGINLIFMQVKRIMSNWSDWLFS